MTDVEGAYSAVARDTEMEKRLLDAVIADANERPRTKQRQVGPSEVGGCRELLRAKLFEPAESFEEETHWAVAAHVGTVMGEDLERIFGTRLDAVTQQRITVTLEDVGIKVSGASDVIFVNDNVLVDLKSTAAIGGVLYEGPKLAYYIQVSLYVMGCVQQGILDPGAEARIVYYDRSGDYQGFVAIVVTWEAIQNFYKVAQQRMVDVMEAQELLEREGNPVLIHHLRDYTPAYCFSPKVMCPRRNHCWGGSEWAPVETLDDENVLSAAKRYIEGRRMENVGKAMKSEARGELQGIEGKFENGPMISWPKGRISVVETAVSTDEQE